MVKLSGLPDRSFQRRFKLATGMAPLEYVHTVRLEESKHLLETTAEPIGRIAQRCGFTSQAYFARVFGRLRGSSPRAYRRTVRRRVVP
jgi:transcriptional regulator GlxA family with amidase domain